MQRLVQTGDARRDGPAPAAPRAAGRAGGGLQRAAEASTTTAADVQRRYDELSGCSSPAAAAELARLSRAGPRLAAAEAAAAAGGAP